MAYSTTYFVPLTAGQTMSFQSVGSGTTKGEAVWKTQWQPQMALPQPLGSVRSAQTSSRFSLALGRPSSFSYLSFFASDLTVPLTLCPVSNKYLIIHEARQPVAPVTNIGLSFTTVTCINLILLSKFFDQMQPDIVQSLNNLHITQNQRNYFFIYQSEDWPRVKPHLIKISQKKFQLKHIASYITHNAKKYSPEYKQQPLQALFKYKDSNLENLFACMALAILEFEQTFRAKNVKMPILRRQSRIEWSYTKKEIIVLLSLMSFCLTLQQGEGKTLPRSYNFAVVFGKEVVKTRTLFLYLEEEIGKDSHQIVTIRRYAESHTLNSLTLMQAKEQLSEVVIHDGGIEDFYGAIKVDFANKFIGGGVLRHGKVQEEIMFINRPEMYISTLFCQCMDSNQAIVFIGFKKYFKQKGYADNVQYDGVQTHKYQFDQKNRANQYIVAIDAIPKPKDQWSELPMLRQINKALAGFKAIDTCKDVATGNWGCGAFGGDVQLKFLLQWISCSMVGMRYCYCPFKNKRLAAVNRVVKKLKGKTVGELFGTLLELPEGKGVFDHIEDYFK